MTSKQNSLILMYVALSHNASIAGVAEWQTRKIKDLVGSFPGGSSSLLTRIYF
ncbi:hypothetical protein LFUMFP_370015 [Latilactobacillus fuchuensis]|uniref:Uncharacterized protein n=1 Tax=Latilactobacillus fuchuensis TaxID=164393 RepID=A0A2N9DXA9_9LACO|nr:hypothetical protein LFUMFP_370015 [Latilactobacillus fuchuensis]